MTANAHLDCLGPYQRLAAGKLRGVAACLNRATQIEYAGRTRGVSALSISPHQLALQDVLDRISYRPGWTFSAEQSSPFSFPDRWQIAVRISAIDRGPTSKHGSQTTLHFWCYVSRRATELEVVEAVLRLIADAEAHERAEWLLYRDEHVLHPHPGVDKRSVWQPCRDGMQMRTSPWKTRARWLISRGKYAVDASARKRQRAHSRQLRREHRKRVIAERAASLAQRLTDSQPIGILTNASISTFPRKESAQWQ